MGRPRADWPIIASMSKMLEMWKEALPEIRNAVTGKNIWSALNSCRPVAIEDGTLVIGLDLKDRELLGHLDASSVRRVIETEMSSRMGSPLTVRIIDGITDADWARHKRRDQEAERLREEARVKMRAEQSARSTWDTVYEQLARTFAAVTNKALPQNRARFLDEAIKVVAEARRDITDRDDLSERNFARCIDRVAQYSEAPAIIIAHMVLQRTEEI